MKTIYNKWIPFGSFYAINLFGVLFVKAKKSSPISERTLNHESIHTAQMKELWYIGFYLWYFIEWAYQGIVWLFYKDMRPYHFITFEQEAYANEDNSKYLESRKLFSWWKFIGKWVKY